LSDKKIGVIKSALDHPEIITPPSLEDDRT
jgi:hypothetical protein